MPSHFVHVHKENDHTIFDSLYAINVVLLLFMWCHLASIQNSGENITISTSKIGGIEENTGFSSVA